MIIITIVKMCGLSLCFMLCFRHSYCAMTLSEGTIKEIATLIRKIQPELMLFEGWTPHIIYNDAIRKKMTLKLRNALKQNNIKVLNMNMETEDYYEKHIAHFIYKILLNYYEKTNIEFEIIPMTKDFCSYNVSENIISYYETNMDLFRTNFLKLNENYSIPINTRNTSEITVLNEKFEKIMLDIIENMNMNSIVEIINTQYKQIQSGIEDETQQLRNIM